MLGKYRIIRQLGQGGMGAVFEAVHTGIGKAVAIKTINPALASDPRSAERFLREAEAASALEHPHVVGVTDFGSEGGVIYLVMELLRGEDLAALIARAPAGLDAAFTVDVMLAVCAGVFAAHETGVVHRDLKPQNIFLAHTALGEVVPKVLDFGISKMVNRNDAHSLTHSGSVMGTTHYLSPEQVQGAPLDGRSDEYALGVILYECLTGRRPHEGDTLYAIMRSISEGRFPPPRELRPDLSTDLEAVVLRAMGIRADDRFPSVHALGCALLGLASPRGRVLWSDYFSRPLGLSGSAAPRTGWQPWAQPAAGPATVFAVRGTPSDVRPVSVIRTNELTQRQGSRWRQATLGLVGLGLAAAAYLTFGPARSLIDSARQTSDPVHTLGAGTPAQKTVAPTALEATAGTPDKALVPAVRPDPPPRTSPPGITPTAAPGEPPRVTEQADPVDPGRKAGANRSLAARTRSLVAAPGARARKQPARRKDSAALTPRESAGRQPAQEPPPAPKPVKGFTDTPILD